MSSETLTPSAPLAAAPRPSANTPFAAARASLTAVLEPGEKVLWWDQPQPVAYTTQGAATTGPVSLAQLVTVVLMAAGAALLFIVGQLGEPSVDWVLVAQGFGLCLLLGVLVVAALAWAARRSAARIVYAVTDRRVLILDKASDPVDAVAMPMAGWRIQRGGDGLDSVIFGTAGVGDDAGTVAFFGIRDVDRVAELAQRTAYVRAGRFPR